MKTADPTGGARPLGLLPALAAAAHRGEKTVTRRLVRPQPVRIPDWAEPGHDGLRFKDCTVAERSLPVYANEMAARLCPLGGVGSFLWVRERAQIVQVHSRRAYVRKGERHHEEIDAVELLYEGDGALARVDWPERLTWVPKPGYCIPNGVHREGARTLLRVEGVRVERLHALTEEDARAEGLALYLGEDGWYTLPAGLVGGRRAVRVNTARVAFSLVWDALAPAGAWWRENPFVWRVEFRRVEG